jgi:uncharacterized protein (TIGR02147 family)
MHITEFEDYKLFIRAKIKTYPKKGRGVSRRLGEHLGVAPVVISQILAQDRHLNPDQALKVASFFGLNEREAEYLVYLVGIARADSTELKDFYQKKLDLIKEEGKKTKSVLKDRKELSETEKSIFYSNWYYSGVSNLTSIKGYQSVNAIADYFGLSAAKGGEIVSFLIETGLCVEEKGKITVGQAFTHVTESSPFVNSHRRNWRLKAMEKFLKPEPIDYFFSSPVSLSMKDAEAIRKQLLEFIKAFFDRIEPSPEERLMCLNVDWFSF